MNSIVETTVVLLSSYGLKVVVAIGVLIVGRVEAGGVRREVQVADSIRDSLRGGLGWPKLAHLST